MRRLGKAVGHTGGLLVVNCGEDTDPVFGEKVYDSSLNEVGETVEFFGPVEYPYALVDSSMQTETGERLYLRD